MTTSKYNQAMQLIQNADKLIVSASNGLSISEGYHIFADNEAFKRYFGKYRKEYGVHSIIQGLFTPLPEVVHEDFMNRLHRYMVKDYQPSEVMQNLKLLLSGRDYFIVTSNGDTHFQINGFPKERLFEVEGNFFSEQEGDAGWQEQRNRFQSFLSAASSEKTVVLELGIGAGNQLIKAPLMRLVEENPDFSYITLNLPREINIPETIAPRSIALPGDIAETIKQLLAEK